MTNLGFHQLLNKQMSRKEFLIHMGLFVLMVSGITSILHALTNPQPTAKKTASHLSSGTRGFGGGKYGV